MSDLCGKCEERTGDIICSCEERFCSQCFFGAHIPRNPRHRQGGTKESERFWNRITGKLSGLQASHFKEDENTKWFGLHIQVHGRDRFTELVETPRFTNLTTDSLYFHKNSPKRQYPSICSFVGDTGAGKSFLIRALIHHTTGAATFKNLETPITGATSGPSTVFSTTGEVNLYLDPATFGTASPTLYADCEGMDGTEPVASQYQKDWTRLGKRHHVEPVDGRPVDRRTAVSTIYPRFLYIFSDVVCYVTRNHKTWAQSAIHLLEWSKAGIQNTINQHTLPALIIVLNGPSMEMEEWLGDDTDLCTQAFFTAVEREISETTEFREQARKNGDKSMQELLARSFSSVYVHLVPLKGFGATGTSIEVMKQTKRLFHRIQHDLRIVQSQRATSWTRFDTRQMSLVINYAFKHLASGKKEPFDFGQCRQQMCIPESIEETYSEFLGYALNTDIKIKFNAAAAVLATSLLRRGLPTADKDFVLLPSAIYSENIKAIISRAIDYFLEKSATCAYVCPDTGDVCVNTKSGHAIGHQSYSGELLHDGFFIPGEFKATNFLKTIEEYIWAAIRAVDSAQPSSRQQMRRLAAGHHLQNIQRLRDLGGLPSFGAVGKRSLGDIGRTSLCYGCFNDRPEYVLPCKHVICAGCLVDFSDDPHISEVSGQYELLSCIICGAFETTGWPYQNSISPDLAGLRVLSLDGGGVRGIIELTTLRRLETATGLEIPIGSYFDLIAGTSAGGLIALGIGSQGLSASDCVSKFKRLCRDGFAPKTLTRSGLGWLARYFRSSIYKTAAFETALLDSFALNKAQSDLCSKQNASEPFYGLEKSCRVVLTTTVNKEAHLIANYELGGKKKYINSDLPLWKAARCTSAAPMYFEPVYHEGDECMDGGLRENNPIQIAINESKKIWGDKVDFDIALSIGCGVSRTPARRPASLAIIPRWLDDLFTSLINTMNGEEQWMRYLESQETRIKNRSTRLNVFLFGETEPELDDVKSVDELEHAARIYTFFQKKPRVFPSMPIPQGSRRPDMLMDTADRLVGSLFFFVLSKITQTHDTYAVRGSICCRLGPEERGFDKLMQKVSGFMVRNEFYKMKKPGLFEYFKLDVSFQEQRLDEPVRIDASFDRQRLVTISGFPKNLGVLLSYWEEQCTPYRELAEDEPDTSGAPIRKPKIYEMPDTSRPRSNHNRNSTQSYSSIDTREEMEPPHFRSKTAYW